MLTIHIVLVLFLLSIVEGLTEFIPVSSTGHMILIGNILNYMNDSAKLFTVIIQLGAILSIIVVFWKRILYISTVCLRNMFIKQHRNDNHLCIRHILIGTLPGVLLGFIYYENIKLIFELIYIVYGLIVGGIFLLVGEICISIRKPSILSIDNITIFQAFLIGCFQCLAFWPGFSRSGATIGGGLILGLNRHTSSRFSFILAIPIIIGSTILTLYHHRFNIMMMDIMLLVIGCIISFLISLLIIKFFLKIIKNISLIPFVVYRFLLAGSIYYGVLI